jgi:hypothetical protein
MLFFEMKERFALGDENLRPSKVIYDEVLLACARDMKYASAEALLFEMVDDFSNGIDEAQPCVRK